MKLDRVKLAYRDRCNFNIAAMLFVANRKKIRDFKSDRQLAPGFLQVIGACGKGSVREVRKHTVHANAEELQILVR